MRRKRTTSRRAIRDAERAALRKALSADLSPIMEHFTQQVMRQVLLEGLGRMLAPEVSLLGRPGVVVRPMQQEPHDE